MKSYQYRKNRYHCLECEWSLVTIDRDSGTTPTQIGCRACGAPAMSSFYPLAVQHLPALGQWIRPGSLEDVPEAYHNHIMKGGLVLADVKLTLTRSDLDTEVLRIVGVKEKLQEAYKSKLS